MIDKESFFISLFDTKYIGDDGAVIGDTIYSKDLFCEDIHFKREWMSLEEISYKSMLINISDAIVMNAKPLYALIGIKIPKSLYVLVHPLGFTALGLRGLTGLDVSTGGFSSAGGGGGGGSSPANSVNFPVES